MELMGKCWSPGFPATQTGARVACQLGLSFRSVKLSLLGEAQEELEARISQKDKMLPAINGWYLASLHDKPHSW